MSARRDLHKSADGLMITWYDLLLAQHRGHSPGSMQVFVFCVCAENDDFTI